MTKAILTKALSIVIAAAMLLALLPAGIIASAADSGECGDNLTWELDDEGALTISGTGAMWDYYDSPWSGMDVSSVVIGDSVTSIGKCAFSYCEGLTSVTIPDSVKSIGYEAFYNTGYYNDELNWEKDVLYIGNWLIRARSSISGSYEIRKETVGIGNYAFYYCTDLTSVTIGSGVRSIGNYAFYYCTVMTSVTIPDSVTSIGNYAFAYCGDLTSITIGSGVTSIGNYAFEYCTGLEAINVSEDNPVYHSAGNCLIERETKTLILGCKNSVIPDDGSVTSIGNYAFEYCTGLTSITIPDSVTSIGDYAFSDCDGLTSVKIGSGVTSIGYIAFYACTGLEAITVSKDNSLYHSAGNCLIESETKTLILGCKSSVIPADGSVTSIGEYAFYCCSGLTSITIPDSVRSIGSYAFGYCSGLTTITIPDSVRSIGDNAFYYCSGLTAITIPDSVTSIGEDAFFDCDDLTSITIGSGVTSIGKNAFEYCTGLEAINVSEDNPVYHSAGNCLIERETKTLILGCKNSVIPADGSVTSIGDDAFYCADLTSITIPNSVTSIGSYAFYYCAGLTSITIPDSVTSIGYGAFYNTGYYNDELNWENDVLYIGNWLIKARRSISGSYEIRKETVGVGSEAFYGCTGLTNVTIPAGVRSIDDSAFTDCEGLTSITIPDSVTSIGYSAFYNTGYYNDELNWEDGVLYIGNWLIAAKEDVSGSYEIKQGTVAIADVAFLFRSELTSVTIPDSVTSIGNYAFCFCTGLTTITIPESVTSIGEGAFHYFEGGYAIEIFYPLDVKMRVYEDSYAHKYATDNGFDYELITTAVTRGDADGDGEITVADALILLRVSAKLAEPTDELIASCDIDNDGEITVADALAVLRVAAKLADASSL